ncbi:MAG: hypothetical protein QOI08_1961 [Actinomycetota bacterium]|jgi:hypothetical protein|nr:hypothetical protein [Actinomycetota bacterium]
MTDILMLAILVAFFALAVLFVRACERIIGPDIETVRNDGAVLDGATDDGAVAA